MTEERSEIARIAGLLSRRWPVVGAACLAGLLAAVAYGSLTGPRPDYVATQRLRVANGVVGVPSVPSVDAVVAAAVLGETRRSVAESLGVEPGALAATSASVDGKNTAVVNVTARHKDAETAKRTAVVLAQAARQRALTQVDPSAAYQNAVAARMRDRIAGLTARAVRMQTLLERPGLSAVERAAYESAATDIEAQLYSAQDKLDQAEYLLEQAGSYVVLDGEVIASKSAVSGGLVTSGLRGAFLGLMAGLVLAWLLERKAGARAV